MTHDPKAVEIVARELMGDGPNSYKSHDSQARAILDAIAPIIVAAEREACAVLCDEAAAAYTDLLAHNAKIVGNDLASMGSMGADACRSRATAIRARKP